MSDRTEYPTAKQLTESLRGEWNKNSSLRQGQVPGSWRFQPIA